MEQVFVEFGVLQECMSRHNVIIEGKVRRGREIVVEDQFGKNQDQQHKTMGDDDMTQSIRNKDVIRGETGKLSEIGWYLTQVGMCAT